MKYAKNNWRHKIKPKKIEETEKLIEKFRAKASKASMAQSMIKKLDKIDRIEVDEDDNSVMNISFPLSKVPGKVVIEADHVTKRYGDKIFKRHFIVGGTRKQDCFCWSKRPR
jgi:ATPase subunit of ABC transporter with duplicated ATPase domains